MDDSPSGPDEESPQRRAEPALARTPLGEIIRRQRELSDLSMRHLARTVGISNPYLSQIERGLREPSDRVLDAIAGALELSTEALYAEAGASPEEERQNPAVVAAVRADPRLTARQRQAMIEVYEAFAGPRRRTR